MADNGSKKGGSDGMMSQDEIDDLMGQIGSLGDDANNSNTNYKDGTGNSGGSDKTTPTDGIDKALDSLRLNSGSGDLDYTKRTDDKGQTQMNFDEQTNDAQKPSYDNASKLNQDEIDALLAEIPGDDSDGVEELVGDLDLGGGLDDLDIPGLEGMDDGEKVPYNPETTGFDDNKTGAGGSGGDGSSDKKDYVAPKPKIKIPEKPANGTGKKNGNDNTNKKTVPEIKPENLDSILDGDEEVPEPGDDITPKDLDSYDQVKNQHEKEEETIGDKTKSGEKDAEPKERRGFKDIGRYIKNIPASIRDKIYNTPIRKTLRVGCFSILILAAAGYATHRGVDAYRHMGDDKKQSDDAGEKNKDDYKSGAGAIIADPKNDAKIQDAVEKANKYGSKNDEESGLDIKLDGPDKFSLAAGKTGKTDEPNAEQIVSQERAADAGCYEAMENMPPGISVPGDDTGAAENIAYIPKAGGVYISNGVLKQDIDGKAVKVSMPEGVIERGERTLHMEVSEDQRNIALRTGRGTTSRAYYGEIAFNENGVAAVQNLERVCGYRMAKYGEGKCAGEKHSNAKIIGAGFEGNETFKIGIEMIVKRDGSYMPEYRTDRYPITN